MQLALEFIAPAVAAPHWWVTPAASLRSLLSAVLGACSDEPRWMVRR